MKDKDFEINGGYIEKLYDIDNLGTSFKVEIYGAWNSCCHEIEEVLRENQIELSFYMASYEESDLWCFSDDVNHEYIKEEYVISYLPYGDEENPKNPINKLTGKHFYNSDELKSIFDELYNKSESIEYYLNYFDEIENGDNSDSIHLLIHQVYT